MMGARDYYLPLQQGTGGGAVRHGGAVPHPRVQAPTQK